MIYKIKQYGIVCYISPFLINGILTNSVGKYVLNNQEKKACNEFTCITNKK